MNKLYLWLGLISLVISIFLNSYSSSFIRFLIYSLILGLIFFIGLVFIVKIIQNIKKKNAKKAIIFGALVIISIVIFSFVFFGIYLYESILTIGPRPIHFSTNVLNGQCKLFYYDKADPWFYKTGCESDEGMIKAAKRASFIDEIEDQCNAICDDDIKSCRKSPWLLSSYYIRCSDVFE